MKRRLQLLLLGVAAACGLAAATLKPGYAYHGSLRPTDQVPTNYEAVAASAVSNVLEAMDLAPVVVTDVVVVVSNVYVTTNAEHWITNNVMDEYRTVVITNTMLTNVHHYVTNTVVRNTVQSFEHWHTNYTHEVTNVYHYETTEFTNVVREVELVPYTNFVYIVTNFVERTNYYHYVTNEVHEVTFSHHTNYVDNVISNFWTTNYVDNVISNFWTTNYVDNVISNLYFTNYVTTVVSNHYVTNYVDNVISNLYVVSNFVEHTWHTNNRYVVNNVISNFTEHTWHTNYDTLVVYESTNYLVNVTTHVDRVVHETNITTEVIADVVTNYYVGTIGDSICFTNGTSLYLLEANNKRYAEYRRVTETRDRYWTAQKFAHLYGTNMQEVSVVPSYSLTVPDVFIEGSNDAFVVTALSDGTAASATFRGSVRPALINASVTDGYVYTYLAMRVDGGWLSVAQDGTTNYCTSATVPALGDWLLFPTAGLTGTGVMPSFYREDGSSTSFGCYLLSGEDVLGAKGGSGDLYYTPYTVGSGKGALKSGKNGTSYAGAPAGNLVDSQFMRFDLGTTPTTLTSDAWVLARVRSLVAYDEMTGYVDNYVAWHAAGDVVTNETFMSRMEAAMVPYTLASYTNAQNAANAARAATEATNTLVQFQMSAQNMLSAYVQDATADANAAKTRAQNASTSAMAWSNQAASYASQASGSASTASSAKDQTVSTYQDFTNWYVTVRNNGSIVTNIYTTGNIEYAVTNAGWQKVDGSVIVIGGDHPYFLPERMSESGWSGGQHPNGSFTFAGTSRFYASGAGGDTDFVFYRNNANPNAQFSSNSRLYESGVTLFYLPSTGKWRLLRASGSLFNGNISSEWSDLASSSWDLRAGFTLAASSSWKYTAIAGGLVETVRKLGVDTTDAMTNLAMYATNTYDMATDLALYATNTYSAVTNLALYATNTYNMVTNLAPYATNTHDMVTNLALYATNTYAAVTNLENMVTNRVDAQIAWDTGSRVVLYITKFLSGDSQKKTMYAASYDSVLSASSAMLTFDSAHDVETGQTGSSDPKVCRISAVGWYGSGSAYAKLGIRLDYDTGTTATNWINTGTAASTLFRSSGYVKTLSNQYMYTSPSASGSSSRTISGTLRVLPKGTY